MKAESASDPWDILKRANGRWEGVESMPPAPWAPDGMVSNAQLQAETILGGRGVASDYRQQVNGKVSLRSHTTIFWDEKESVFRMCFVTADGSPPTLLEGARDGDRLVFEGKGPMGTMRQVFEYGPEEMKVVAEIPEDGSWRRVFEGHYRRVDPGVAR